LRSARRILYFLYCGHEANVAFKFTPIIESTEYRPPINNLSFEAVIKEAEQLYGLPCAPALDNGFANYQPIAAGAENYNTRGLYGQGMNLLRQTDKTLQKPRRLLPDWLNAPRKKSMAIAARKPVEAVIECPGNKAFLYQIAYRLMHNGSRTHVRRMQIEDNDTRKTAGDDSVAQIADAFIRSGLVVA
jgi:hypothetical protein